MDILNKIIMKDSIMLLALRELLIDKGLITKSEFKLKYELLLKEYSKNPKFKELLK